MPPLVRVRFIFLFGQQHTYPLSYILTFWAMKFFFAKIGLCWQYCSGAILWTKDISYAKPVKGYW
jgi:hypothetical protein